MFQTKVVEKIKTHILCSVLFFRKSHHLRDNVGKYGRIGQATGCNVIRRMCIECRVYKATDRHQKYVILTVLRRQQWSRERVPVLC
jgi:hypothetical protein